MQTREIDINKNMISRIGFVLISFVLMHIRPGETTIETDKVDCHPQQVHVAYGDSIAEMVVMWSTIAECSTSIRFGRDPWGKQDTVQGTHLRLPGLSAKIPYLHRVKLNNLKPNTTYYYSPQSNLIISGPFFFKTPPEGQDWQPEFMVYGDLGVHSESLPNLEMEALKGIYSAILHVGDFGYNLFDTISTGQYAGENVGDVFMQQIEEMASHVPYMVSPGNHEIEADTFNQYRYRFSMPNTDWPIPLNKMWYSLDIGPVHFLSYSTEVFFIADGMYVDSQLAWIKADLAAANNNRHSRPWVIAYGHRPFYCSNSDGDDCTKEESLVRQGLEDVFYQSGVDVILQAHEHSYERLWPMYKGVVLAENYTNPAAPVQLITGAAGSKHGVDEMLTPAPGNWSAFRMDNKSFNSYGRLKVYNTTHLHWEQVGTLNGEMLDSIWIIQESHGPFKQTGLKPEQKEKIDEQIQKEQVIKQNRKSKPKTTGDTLTEKVTKAIKGADIRIIIAVSCGSFVVFVLLIVCIIRKCRRRPKSYRRWETLDYGKKFYTNLKNEDKDADDFEVDVTDGTTKLIENGGD